MTGFVATTMVLNATNEDKNIFKSYITLIDFCRAAREKVPSMYGHPVMVDIKVMTATVTVTRIAYTHFRLAFHF